MHIIWLTKFSLLFQSSAYNDKYSKVLIRVKSLNHKIIYTCISIYIYLIVVNTSNTAYTHDLLLKVKHVLFVTNNTSKY